MAEKYYLAKKVKNPFSIDAFNFHVIRRTGKSLELLTSEKIQAEKLGIGLVKGRLVCSTGEYQIMKTTKKAAEETIKKLEMNYSNLGGYFSGSENRGSPQLNGSSGESLP